MYIIDYCIACLCTCPTICVMIYLHVMEAKIVGVDCTADGAFGRYSVSCDLARSSAALV
jgi:hypothetical protein